MIDCNEAVRQLWDYIENQLDADNKVKVDEHLSFCRTCCGEVEFAEEMRTVMKDAAKPAIPDDVASRLALVIDDLESTDK